MKVMIASIVMLIFTGVLSAQSTNTNTNKEQSATTTTTNSTKSKPVIKKQKVIVVQKSKVAQTDGMIKEGNSTNAGKKPVENGQPK